MRSIIVRNLLTHRLYLVISLLLCVAFSQTAQGQLGSTDPVILNQDSLEDLSYYGNDSHPRLATDRDGMWLCVWSSNFPLGEETENDLDIMFAISNDNGATWSDAQFLVPEMLNDRLIDDFATITTDANGVWLVVWNSTRDINGDEVNEEALLYSRSIDNGESWSSPALLHTDAVTSESSNVSHAQVATDESGNWITVWHTTNPFDGDNTPDSDIAYARSSDNGATWGTTQLIDPGALTDGVFRDEDPSIAMDTSGNVIVTWMQATSMADPDSPRFDAYMVASSDSGATWTEKKNIESPAETKVLKEVVESAQIVTNNTGTWLIAWESQGSDFSMFTYTTYSTDLGQSWHGRQLVKSIRPTTLFPAQTSVVHASANTWILVRRTWNPIATETLEVSTSSNLDLPWSEAVLINDPEYVRYERTTFALGSDHSGKVLIASSGNDTRMSLYDDEQDAYTQTSLDAGTTWSEPTHVNSFWRIDRSAEDANPSIATDGKGNYVTAWESRRSMENSGLADNDILMAASIDNAVTWSASQHVNFRGPENDGLEDIDPKVATDRAGTWIIVWSSREVSSENSAGKDYDIYYNRSTDNGASWGDATLLNAAGSGDPAANNDLYPEIVTDTSGNFLVVWKLSASGSGPLDSGIYVSRSVDSGITWSTPLNLINEVDPERLDRNPDIATDDAGHCLVAWQSTAFFGSTGGDWDIHVASSDDFGVTWTNPRLLNTTGDSDADNVDDAADIEPSIVYDSAGAWIATWSSTFNLNGMTGTDEDVFAARSTDSGLTWSTPVALDCMAEMDDWDDESIELACDSDGSCIAMWRTLGMLLKVAETRDGGITWSSARGMFGRSTYEFQSEHAVVANGTRKWIAATVPSTDRTGAPFSDRDVHVNEVLGIDFLENSPALVLRQFRATDMNQNGLLTSTEFKAVFGDYPYIFRNFDSNSTGYLTRPELQRQIEEEKPIHNADVDGDATIGLTELMRVIQFYNSEGYRCTLDPDDTEDGFEPFPPGDLKGCCVAHAADYEGGPNAKVELSELLRIIQLHTLGAMSPCVGASEDGFCVEP